MMWKTGGFCGGVWVGKSWRNVVQWWYVEIMDRWKCGAKPRAGGICSDT